VFVVKMLFMTGSWMDLGCLVRLKQSDRTSAWSIIMAPVTTAFAARRQGAEISLMHPPLLRCRRFRPWGYSMTPGCACPVSPFVLRSRMTGRARRLPV